MTDKFTGDADDVDGFVVELPDGREVPIMSAEAEAYLKSKSKSPAPTQETNRAAEKGDESQDRQ